MVPLCTRPFMEATKPVRHRGNGVRVTLIEPMGNRNDRLQLATLVLLATLIIGLFLTKTMTPEIVHTLLGLMGGLLLRDRIHSRTNDD